MPKKRIQVLLRDRVYEIVEALSGDENLPMSKVCSMLIEESLMARGEFSKSRPADTPGFIPKGVEMKVVAKQDPIENARESLAAASGIDDEDLKLLRKLKMLKELNLL